jgi:polysaccharide biosynthesis protein PslG
MRRLSTALVLPLLIALVPIVQAQNQRCFPETNQCVSGRIREFWEHNGGLPVFGFPTTDQHEELVEGKPFQVQWFQRNRLELHPENQRPYDVLLGRLGVDRLQQQGRDWFTFPKGSEQPGCRFFAESGHALCGAFLNYFRTHGLDLGQPGTSEAESLALFGLPLSEASDEVNPTDGQTYLTQHFERTRFELHMENQPPFDVLLGLLGNEIRDSGEPAPQPQPTAAPAPPTATPARSGNCDPSYPDVCIPPPPPDLDCGDIPYRNFKVLPPDPHRFDRDHDGIGCET